MNREGVFQAGFGVLLGLMVLMRAWFAFRVRQAGEPLLPDRAAVRREGWLVFSIRCVGFLLLLVLIVLLLSHRLGAPTLSLPLPLCLRGAGFGLGLASLGLWTWTHVALGRFWSAQLQLRAGHRLVTRGPYSRIRHPMYTAILGWVLSLGLVIANWAALLFARWTAVILVTRIPREEQMMLERFGDEYREYMKRTGRFLPRWTTRRRAVKVSPAA